MLGAATELKKAIPGIEVDAAVSRQVSAGINALAARRNAGTLPGVVVVHLGNNGTFTTKQFDQMMGVLKDVPRVIFVTLKVPRSWESGDNAVIRAGVSRYPNTQLVDWHGASAGRPELFARDGYHLTGAGAKLYTSLVAGVLGR